MGSCELEPQKLYIETPCIPSPALSRAAGCNIFLKLENLQPSGSFKSRGIGHMMQQAMFKKPDGNVHFYCSSGGNAGLACATAAKALGRPCTIVVPLTTAEHMIGKMRLLGAKVHQTGSHWALADAHLRAELLAHDPSGVYVSPFDHPDIWEGASTMVDELTFQMDALRAPAIDAIVCNCGGGGLLNGVMEGVERIYGLSAAEQEEVRQGLRQSRNMPRVVVAETRGADSLNASIRAGELVTLPAITSVATSLGAPRVSERSFLWATEQQRAGLEEGEDGERRLTSVVVSDAEAVAAAARFADDARMLVEIACGATLATVYNGDLRRVLGKGLGGRDEEEWSRMNVVVIVCGGSNVSLDMLREYQAKFGVNGEGWEWKGA
ncbi:catabolic L-serine/threonine dehydratase [Parahypoxylon ruwenzoriense]